MKLKLNSMVVVLGLVACSLSAQAQQTVKIGFLGTLSGPAGALGQDQYDASCSAWSTLAENWAVPLSR